jgi:flagellar export protein FliJ
LKRFAFSLETLRRLRVQARQEAETEVTRLASVCTQIVAQMKAIQTQIEQGHQTSDPAWIDQEQAFRARQRGTLEGLASDLLDHRREEAYWRQLLAQRRQEEEVMDQLREAQWKSWRKAMRREEQKILDDLPYKAPNFF